MFKNFFKNIFKNKKRQEKSELIKQFDEALYFIETYEKAHDYKTAIMATRELILKHKSGINYYEDGLKKLYSLEASNIENISNAAKIKIKKVKNFLDIIYKRLSALEKKLMEIEKDKEKADNALKSQVEIEQYKHRVKEIKEAQSKKDYIKSVSLSKKLVYDFQGNKEALKILQINQKLFDKDKTKKERDQARQEKINKTLKEMGIDEEKIKASGKTFSSWDAWKLKIRENKRKKLERNDYIKRMKTLGKLEMLLLKTGSISNVSNIDVNQDEMFSIINSGLTKEIQDFEMYGFDVFGKIIGKDKIIGDTFGHFKTGNNKTVFYIGDATGHGIQAGFTVAVLSKIFYESNKVYKLFQEFFVKVNNELKEKIKGKSFITGIFFEWNYLKNELKMIGAGHIPIFIYRRKTGAVEKIIPGGLAMGVRLISNVSSIKVKDILLEEGDVLFSYTDGILETKDGSNTMYGIDRLEKSFTKWTKIFLNPEKIYENMFNDIKEYKGVVDFDDDVSFFLFTRNTKKDLIVNKQELEQILKESNSKKSLKDIQIKKRTKEEIIEELKKEKHDRELKIRLDRLDRLAKIGEFIKLKQEVLMYYKEGYVHDKMRKYLEKAIANEQNVTTKKLEEKLQKKYTTLLDLYKKGEYEIVVKEALDVIFKSGKI